MLIYSYRFYRSHGRSRQILNRPPPRQKEIAAAARGDEAGQLGETDRPVMGRNAVAGGAVAGAGQRIALAGETMERGAVDPGLLQEFELPLDIAVQADEEQAGLLSRLRLIAPADADNAMPIADRDLLFRAGRETLARIGAADMRAERTAQALRVLGAEQEVVVRRELLTCGCAAMLSWRGGDLRRPLRGRRSHSDPAARQRMRPLRRIACRVARIAHQRRAVAPAPHDLGGDEF